MHELIALGDDPAAAHAAAAATRGISYVVAPDDTRDNPFRTLVRAATDQPELLEPAASVGMYTGFSRVIRERPTVLASGEDSPGVTAIFGMVRHPSLTHAQADAHWRDTHAPLALRHHPGMWDYTQLSVVATHHGFAYDGFAMVAFASLDDMRNRFFGDEHDREVIRDDVAKFADGERSPRRVVATERVFRTRPPTPTRTHYC